MKALTISVLFIVSMAAASFIESIPNFCKEGNSNWVIQPMLDCK